MILGLIACSWSVDQKIEVPFLYSQFVRVFPGFFAGCLTCALWQKFKGRRIIRAFTAASALVAALYVAFVCVSPSRLGDKCLSSTVFSAALLFLTVTLRPLSRLLSLQPFKLLGELSFSIYLTHAVIYLFIFGLLVSAHIVPAHMHGWPIFLLYLGVVLAISVLSYFCFEKPMQRWIRKKYYAYREKKQVSGDG